MQTTKTVEQLPCKLTAEEMLMKSKQLVQLAKDKAALEDEKKEATARIKAEIEKKDSAMHVLVDELHRGEELRPIECFERPRYGDMMVDIVRTDDATVWKTRPMHPNERQTALDMGEIGPKTGQPGRTKRKRNEAPESAH